MKFWIIDEPDRKAAPDLMSLGFVGAWIVTDTRKYQAHAGTYSAAAAMCEMGYPIEIALFVLTGRSPL
jgi:hypothetical protein